MHSIDLFGHRARALQAQPRGIVVTREGGLLDEFALADGWRLLTVGLREDWLELVDARGRALALYRPDDWRRVEAGRADEIRFQRDPEAAEA